MRSAVRLAALGLLLSAAGASRPAAAERSVCDALRACEFYGAGSIPGSTRDALELSPAILEDGTPNSQVGALGSAIAYTGTGDLYVTLPDRGPKDGATSFASRFYLVNLTLGERGRVTATLAGASRLRQANGAPFTGLKFLFDADNSPGSLRFDPEALRVTPRGTLFVTDEYGPTVNEFAADGTRLRTLPVPDKFKIARPDVESAELPPTNRSGRQSNRAFEGLAISPDGGKLYAAMQSPLIQDGGLDAANVRVGTNTRILELDVSSGKSREFLYPLESPKHGVNEILGVDGRRFLVLERDSGSGAAAVFKRLFLIDVHAATDVSAIPSLPTSGVPAGAVPVDKRLFLDLLDPSFGLAGSTFPEKIEGIAFGPDRPDGKHVLVVTSDNDASATEDNRFFVFLIGPAALPTFVPQKARFKAKGAP